MSPVRRGPRRRAAGETGPPSARSVDESGLVEVPLEGGLCLEGLLAGLTDVFVAGVAAVSIGHGSALYVSDNERSGFPSHSGRRDYVSIRPHEGVQSIPG